MSAPRTVAVVWRGDDEARRTGIASNERLRPVFDALAGIDIEARPVIHDDGVAEATRAALDDVDGVLVWVDPIGRGEDRRRLDAILREVASTGTWVSAHPDVIASMGTKDVLYRTRHLGWGSDVHVYPTLDALRAELPPRLANGARVLKPRRGNGGIGVWKVELDDPGDTSADPGLVVHGAEVRDTEEERITFAQLLERCRPHFDDDGCVIDQAFQPRVAEGLIRCYLVADRVAGFARQGASDLLIEPGAAARVMGLPSPKTMYPRDEPDLARLGALVEDDWLPAMIDVLGYDLEDLPALWDADFLLGSPGDAGEDTYVLCEINCSCVTPFPPQVPVALATVVRKRLERVPTRR